MSKALRQKPAPAGRSAVGRGEAPVGVRRDEACGPRGGTDGTGSALLQAALTRENLQRALKRVRANKGSAGVDGLDIDQTVRKLVTDWPRIREQLLQGTYRPSPVRRVTIPKPDGGQRELGIPTVTDRLIQQALLQVLQPLLDPTFSEHSYGFRPGRRAHDAVLAAQSYVQSGRRVVVDVDLEKFFDRVNHDILIDRLQKRIADAGVIRLVRAYLNAGIMDSGVVMERYADDAVCHCHSQARAQALIEQLRARFAQCGLELHPQKTRVVYCKGADRRGSYPDTSFDFLGFTFRPRLSKNRYGKTFVNFSPAVSAKAAKSIRQEVRGWNLHLRSDKALDDLARMFNATIRGWVNYYGAFYKSALYPTLRQIDRKLVLWATRKFKRLRRHRRRASHWLARIARKHTRLFAHWPLLWGQASMGRAG